MLEKILTLGKPDVFQIDRKILGDELRELVLKSLARVIGERKIVRIGADAESALASGGDAKRRTERRSRLGNGSYGRAKT